MGRDATGGGMNRLTGRFTTFGIAAALIACAIDQASKLYLLFVYDLGARGVVNVMPFLDFVLTRNRGISYGLFQQDGPLGQWVLLAFKAVAVVALAVWVRRASSRLMAFSLGLIIGGALGNAIDRLAYGWVADFVLFYAATPTWRFNWYVFNLADVAIVAGVVGVLYDSLLGPRAVKAP